MSLLDADHLPELRGKEGYPVQRRHNHTPMLIADQLCLITFCRLLDHFSNRPQAADSGSLEETLEEPEAPIGRELCVTHYQEGQRDVSVPSCDGPPQQVPDHVVVLVLARAVVCVEVHISLACMYS